MRALFTAAFLILLSSCGKPKLKTEYRVEFSTNQNPESVNIGIRTKYTYDKYVYFSNQGTTFTHTFTEAKKTFVEVSAQYNNYNPNPYEVPDYTFRIYRDGKLVKEGPGNVLNFKWSNN